EIDGQTRARIMPLLRLQGAIDAQGLELSDLCGLPPKLLAETQAWIDDLRARELALKRRGRWQSSDLLRHTADRLRAIDRLVYPAKHFDDVAEIDELVRAEIAGGSVAIVCRSTAGIYEVERQLRRRHGRIASAALRSTSVMIAALALACILRLLDDRIGLESGIAPSLASQFPMLLLGFGGAFFFLRGRRAPGIYGLRRFAGLDWCLVLPFAMFGALAGGVWTPAVPLSTFGWPEFLALLTLPVAADLIFRGLVQGS